METKENSTLSQEKSNETRIVVLALQPDGKAVVKSFKREGALPESFVLKDSIPVESKQFDTLPKRMGFFFEKNF